ncbi:hypothetical protein GGR57DRAFT_322379 [Xylariaceae sp. FL1272]|nr:hypothetical protein GGR57DRAFT_322379 [Xylariaceae sp. FL1272]
MKVLVLGATGNLGSRLVPALLTHNHSVVAFVRSSKKLESLLPTSVNQQIHIVEGDATNSTSVKKAILSTDCDAVVSAAGLAAVAPWGKSDLPTIFRAVVEGVRDAAVEKKKPVRTWMLGGQGVLNYPGTDFMLSNYIPIFLEHRQNFKFLESLPPDTVHWSMLCPQTMTPESSDLSVPLKSAHGKLVAKAAAPPEWKDSWMKSIPLIGKHIVIGSNASRYATTLEQNADFIASDLENRQSEWIGKAVGVIDPAK